MTQTGRRGAIRALLAFGGALLGGIVGAPTAAFLLAPLRATTPKSDGKWRRVADLTSLDSDKPKAATVYGDVRDAWTVTPKSKLGTIWLRKKSDRHVLALSAECPHLGCRIGLDADKNQFVCPCHDSAFDREGRVLHGPSPRPMDAIPCRVREGAVEVQFSRFRPQTRDRVKVG